MTNQVPENKGECMMERLINRILYGASSLSVVAGLIMLVGIAGRDDLMTEMGAAFNPIPGLLTGMVLFVVGFGLRVLAAMIEENKK